MHWTGSLNKSIDQIAKNCPKNVRRLCFQPLRTIFGYFLTFFDIFRTFCRHSLVLGCPTICPLQSWWFETAVNGVIAISVVISTFWIILKRFRVDVVAIWLELQFQIARLYCNLKPLRLRFSDVGIEWRAHVVILLLRIIPESEVQAEFFADTGQKRGEILAKFLAFLLLNIQRNCPREIHEKSSPHYSTRDKTFLFSPRDPGSWGPCCSLALRSQSP